MPVTHAAQPGPPLRPVLVLSTSPVLERPNRTVLIDRKFHVGMLEYVNRLRHPLACLVPRMPDGSTHQTMDHVEVSTAELPYRLFVVSSPKIRGADLRILKDAIRGSGLVYVGASERINLLAAKLARQSGIPYAVVTEYTLRTELDIMRATTESPLRRIRRDLRLRAMHRRKLRMIEQAAAVHANGYPTFRELAGVHRHRLLFLDTRARRADVISPGELADRLAGLSERAPRLLFTGRYHPMKGALDVVKVGVELCRLRCRFTLDLYGTGPERAEMVRLVDAAGAQDVIRIHDPVPFRPELLDVTRTSDLFLACHVQGDPSCTYVETFASGVPIVGYGNEMWEPLCASSGGGLSTPAGDVRRMAAVVSGLLRAPARLGALASKARAFAAEHVMEDAWDARAAALDELAL